LKKYILYTMGCYSSKDNSKYQPTDLIFLSNDDTLKEGYIEDELYLPLDVNVPGGVCIATYKYAKLLMNNPKYIFRVKLDQQTILTYTENGPYKIDSNNLYSYDDIKSIKCKKIYIYDKQYIWTNEELCNHFIRIDLNNYYEIESKTMDIARYAILHGIPLEDIPSEFIDFNFIEYAIRYNGMNLSFLDNIQMTKKLALLGVKDNGLALQFVPDNIQYYSNLVYYVYLETIL